MDFVFRTFRQMRNNLIGAGDTDEDDYVPTNLRGKRKASEELHRTSKARRYSEPPRPYFTPEDYARSEIWEGTAERRTSKAGLLGAGVNTLVLDSGTDSEFELEPQRRFSTFNIKKTPVRRGSPAKPASPERVRAGRLIFLDKLGERLGDVVGDLQGAITEADKVDMTGAFPEATSILEHARIDLEHARDDVEEVQAQIEHHASSSQPIHKHQPGPAPEYESDYIPTPVSVPFSRHTSNDSAWTETPNVRARRIVRDTPSLEDAASQIKTELGEPEYAYRDIEIRDTIWRIMDKMERFARNHFSCETTRNKKALQKAFSVMEPETARMIGCVASGGPGGEDGWRELFWDEQKRRALICAVVGNVLVEQVFQHACFGADDELLKELRAIQEEMQDEDGFARNAAYAEHLKYHLLSPSNTLHLPPNFKLHISTIICTICTHLRPFLSLANISTTTSAFPEALASIVTTAGILSLQMRLDPHTVYYHTPMFKEDIFQSKYMEAFNKKKMMATHPREDATVWPEGTTEAEKNRAKGDEPLTQIALLHGITAYRKGGWETKDSDIWDPVYAGNHDGQRGIRARVLVHGWVYCRWGRARKFVEGKPADDPRVHGSAWKHPGFVEFRTLAGVPDPDRKGDGSRKSSASTRRSSGGSRRGAGRS